VLPSVSGAPDETLEHTMETTSRITEGLPTAWDADRDERFFALVARLFSAEFVFGAGVLLAADDE
jgi:hypothetical protein